MIVKAQGDVISLSGALTANHWHTIKAAAKLLIRQQRLGIIIDCSGVSSITAEGSHTFRDAVGYFHSPQNSAKARIIVCGLTDALREQLLKEPGVRSSLATARSVDEARASLKLESWNHPSDDSQGPCVLVPLLDGEATAAAVRQGFLLAREVRCRLYLVSLLEVPMAHHLDAPLPELEEQAEVALAQATSLVVSLGGSAAPHVRRTRDRADGLYEAAEALQATHVVVGLARRHHGQPAERVVDALLKRGTSEVLVTYGAPAGSPTASPTGAIAGSGARETHRLGVG